MPRKTNGYGSFGAGAVRGVGSRTDIGKARGAAGLYPSNRQYGSSVNRSVIEKWDLDSDWVKWRKGFEYYNLAAWYRLDFYNPETQDYESSSLNSKLYQGTAFEIDVTFDGYRFPTSLADSNNHYVLKRTPEDGVNLGTVTQVMNDPTIYTENRADKEIHVKIDTTDTSRLFTYMLGERVTDGETEASLSYVLTADNLPAFYLGKSWTEDLTEVTSTVDKAGLMATDFMEEHDGDIQALVGMIVYIPNFFVDAPLADVEEYSVIDRPDYFGVQIADSSVGPQKVQILDPSKEALPPSLYDISSLPLIYEEADGGFEMTGTFVFMKDQYQKYYGTAYLTGDLVISKIINISYTMMPYKVLSVLDLGNGSISLKSYPFIAELKLYPDLTDGTLVFADYSFTKTELDEYANGNYHSQLAPGEAPWRRIDTDVDPWMDEVFTSGEGLRPATVYTCSCPNHAKAILRAPQSTEGDGDRKINRQRRFPLPTALGKGTFDALGTNQAAGIVESWESIPDKMKFKMCKHSIAAMFIEHLKVKEPSKYPSSDTRIKFEDNLRREMEQTSVEFAQSYKRGGITGLELVFSLAQGLNLDDTETAYVILNTNF